MWSFDDKFEPHEDGQMSRDEHKPEYRNELGQQLQKARVIIMELKAENKSLRQELEEVKLASLGSQTAKHGQNGSCSHTYVLSDSNFATAALPLPVDNLAENNSLQQELEEVKLAGLGSQVAKDGQNGSFSDM
jgi:hypothetical protein